MSLRVREVKMGSLTLVTTALVALASGCASPGPPHAPSLNLPRLANDLTVDRAGDRVELHFNAPARSTDNLPLPNTPLQGTFCRQRAGKPCVAAGGLQTFSPGRQNTRTPITWVDILPPELLHGSPRLLGYRVELLNAAGKSAGKSDEAFTVAGEAPPAVAALHAEGTRLGVLLQWNPAPGAAQEIRIRREDISPASAGPAAKQDASVAELEVSAADAAQHRVLDTTARPERAYRYTAVRRAAVQLGGRHIELTSAASPAVVFELHLVYPPPPPTALTAAGFMTETTPATAAGFAVDLIWQPVDDAGLLAGLAGYNIYREDLHARTRLNATPVQVPAFHDATARPTERYRYTVTAVDGRGNESGAASVVLEPSNP